MRWSVVALVAQSLFPATFALGGTIRQPSAADATAMQQTLALFTIAVDREQWDLMGLVFTPDVVATFSPTPAVTGVPAIESLLAHTLAGVETQHGLTTLFINMLDDCTANVTNYLHTIVFGQGAAAGQTLQNFAYYQDIMVKQKNDHWLVKERVLHSLGTVGNTSILPL